MSTGIENWLGNMAELGPLYPFVGSEFILWGVGVALWIVWQVSCTRAESQQYRDEIEKHGDAETLKKTINRH